MEAREKNNATIIHVDPRFTRTSAMAGIWIVRTEFGAVYVQPDFCNGCAYCVVACPFGVIQRNEHDGPAFKCTFCSDRQKVGLEPACAKACPTKSIMFGNLDKLRVDAKVRLEELQARGMLDAQIYDPLRHVGRAGGSIDTGIAGARPEWRAECARDPELRIRNLGRLSLGNQARPRVEAAEARP